ncbi:MAG: hypothetical protein V1676_01530 [Candidatus Diapherotrites archaeon]
MNSRGIYTALVAIIVIAAIGGTFLYMRKPTLENGAEITARSVREVKMAWENARIVLDEATGGAITGRISERFDGVCDGGTKTLSSLKEACENNISDGGNTVQFEQEVETKLRDIFGKIKSNSDMEGGGIEIGGFDHPREGPGDAIKINANFWLMKSFGNGNSVTYNRNAAGKTDPVRFQHYVEASGACTGTAYRCEIADYDMQTGTGKGSWIRKVTVAECPIDCGTAQPGDCSVTVSEWEQSGYDISFKADYVGADWGKYPHDALVWSWEPATADCTPRPFTDGRAKMYCNCNGETEIEATATIKCEKGGEKSGTFTRRCPVAPI